MKKLMITMLAVLTAVGFSMAQQKESAQPAPSKESAPAAQPADAGQPAASTDSLKEKIESVKGAVDGVKEDYLATKSTVDKLSHLKISGYTQVQFRQALNQKDAVKQSTTDTAGMRKTGSVGNYYYPVGDFSGGKFGNGMGSVIQLRRARLKVAYETELTQGVIQADFLPFTAGNALGTSTTTTQAKDTVGGRKFDTSVTVNQKPTAMLNGGGVTIKDVYLRFTEPWLKTFSIVGGFFNRPFGYEISYSSSARETPERSRAEQTLFPGERDLGASIEMLPLDNMPQWFQLFNFRGGIFTGNGINVESDDARDYIGRLGMSIPLKQIGLGLDFGASGYIGKVTDWNDAAYSFNADSKMFVKSTGNYDRQLDRKYWGGDLQLYFDIPFIGGLSLRGEGYKGLQPALATSASSFASPNLFVNDANNTSAIYSRNFLGYYVWWVQNIDVLRSQFVLKYDSWDPNTNVAAGDFDSLHVVNGGLSPADIMFNTWGVGWIYHWDENVKFMAYLDFPKPEQVTDKPGSTYFAKNATWWPYINDNMKAGVFTFRIQYKF
jgi:Phosphate-selective porin O and P